MTTTPIPGLTPGIARTVTLLQSWGFGTCDSGDGVANVEAGMEGARPEPHVVMQSWPEHVVEEAKRLAEKLRSVGVDVKPIGPEPGAPCIQASYDPASSVALIDLMNVDDALLARLGAEV